MVLIDCAAGSESLKQQKCINKVKQLHLQAAGNTPHVVIDIHIIINHTIVVCSRCTM